jgi:hypothetical protein
MEILLLSISVDVCFEALVYGEPDMGCLDSSGVTFCGEKRSRQQTMRSRLAAVKGAMKTFIKQQVPGQRDD